MSATKYTAQPGEPVTARDCIELEASQLWERLGAYVSRHGYDAAADGLLAVHRHRRQQDTQIFLRVAECLLPRDDRFVVRFLDAPRRQILDIDQVLPEPFAVRMLGRQLTLDLLVVEIGRAHV